MSKSSDIVVGLDIGTSKVCALVGEVNQNGMLSIRGIGQAVSKGVRKGEIINAAVADENIREALSNAEQMANVVMCNVYLGVSGSHIQGFNNRGVHTVFSPEHEITKEDVQDVIKNAKAINLPHGNHVIHAIRQHFLVDGHEGITDPEGLLGTRLEVDMHVVHGNLNRLQNPIRVVKGLQLEVETVVFNGLAASLAVLTNEQKELGALVIDLGAGTTDYVVCANGIIKYSGSIAVGGDHVTNDLAIGLKLPNSCAEQLKIDHGNALQDDSLIGKTIALRSDSGLSETRINLEHLRCITSVRLEEILSLIGHDLEQAGLLSYLRAGVFLCGGVARTPQIKALAERVFHLPVTMSRITSISSLSSKLDQPEFATAMGLVKFGSIQLQQHKTKKSLVQRLISTLSHIF